MEQIQQLIEILKQTPDLALWGISIYFLFILLKLASWVSALGYVTKLFIIRYFDWKEKELPARKGARIAAFFQKRTLGDVEEASLLELISNIKKPHLSYIHESDIRDAIKAIKESRK